MTLFVLGDTVKVWLRSHCRGSGANGVSTSGCHVSKIAPTSRKSVRNANPRTGISRARVTGKRPDEVRFPQPTGLKWTPFDLTVSECGRWDSNPQFSARDGGFKDRCVFQFHHCRIFAVRVGRISGSPLHLSQLHLQFCQLRNLSLFQFGENLADRKRGVSSVEPTALSVRFREGPYCWQQCGSAIRTITQDSCFAQCVNQCFSWVSCGEQANPVDAMWITRPIYRKCP